MAPFSLKIIRSVFAAMEPVVPHLAGRSAFALFQRTPDPDRVSEREKKLNANALPFMAEARRHCLTTPYGRVSAFEFAARRRRTAPAVLVIHGWGSRSEHMLTIVARLLEGGYRVVTLDLPGHGTSEGRRLNMMTAVAAVKEAALWLGPFSAVVGHSFGGAVALNAAFGSVRGFSPLAVDRLVLISAPSSIPALFEDFGRFLALGPRTRLVLAEQVAAITGRKLEDFVGTDQLRQLRMPALIVHAPDDKEVAFSEAEAYAGAGDHVELFRAGGLGHRRILADERVADRIAIFLAGERLARQNQRHGADDMSITFV
jgi:pimeloyl-ACP methyl ester carboxylesterase